MKRRRRRALHRPQSGTLAAEQARSPGSAIRCGILRFVPQEPLYGETPQFCEGSVLREPSGNHVVKFHFQATPRVVRTGIL